VCIAVPGQIVSIDERTPVMVPGRVVFPDRELTVNLVMVPDATIGDHVIVHSGFAIRIVSAETAEIATALLCPDTFDSATEPAAE